MKSTRIALLYLYYGTWPWYFKFFLKSCSLNPEVDFIIISDLEPPERFSRNIKFLNRKLSEVEKIASTKLGFEVRLKNPYKLCDFKPTYGFIFDDIISEYDFWGHGDIDLVFGKISNFITLELMENYDVISVRHDYPSGFFMLYRNHPITNKLFMKSKDYVHILSSDQHFCFDECNFQHDYLLHGANIFDTKAAIESMMHVIKNAEANEGLRTFFNFCVAEGIPGRITWDCGTLSYLDQYEILLYHFIQLKNNYYFNLPNWKKIPDTFYIEKNAFFKSSRKSLSGIIQRIFTTFQIDLRMGFNNILLKANEVLCKIGIPRGYLSHNSMGIFKCGNMVLRIYRDGQQCFVSLTYPKIEKTKMEPVFYDRNLLVSYQFNFLLRLHPGKIIFRPKSGQKFIYIREKVEASVLN